MPSRSGFTLLEMLVALALMAVLAGGLYLSLRIGFDARERGEATVAPIRAMSAGLELVRRDVESVLPPTGLLAGPFLGEDGVGDLTADEADTLTFYTVNEDAGRGTAGIRLVAFALSEESAADGALLVRTVTTNLLAPTTQEPDEEVVCRRVSAFNVRYFDGTTWVERWDSVAQGDALPFAIEVTLTTMDHDPDAADGMEEGRSLTRVFVPACASDVGEESGGVTGLQGTQG